MYMVIKMYIYRFTRVHIQAISQFRTEIQCTLYFGRELRHVGGESNKLSEWVWKYIVY